MGVSSGVGALDSGFLCVGVAALSLSSFTPSNYGSSEASSKESACCLLQDKHNSTYSRYLQEICTFAPDIYPHTSQATLYSSPTLKYKVATSTTSSAFTKDLLLYQATKIPLTPDAIYCLAMGVSDVLRTLEDLKNLLTLLYPQVIGL